MNAKARYAAGDLGATDPALRGLSQEDLVMRHADLVKRIAYHLVSRMPPNVEVDDLIQAGMIGLLDAARHYTASKGANFETYAGIRIRGAMLDEVRKSDWTPRSVHRSAREMSCVQMEPPSPYGVLFASANASASSAKRCTASTGPNTSSRATRPSAGRSVSTVGSR